MDVRVWFVALHQPAPPLAAQHVYRENIIEAVTIDVRDIDGHGGKTGLPYGRRGRGAKVAVTIVDPKTIRRGEVVARVNIRRSIAVEIAHHHAQAPIQRSF